MKKVITILLIVVIACHVLAYYQNLLPIDELITCIIGYFVVWGVARPIFFEDNDDVVTNEHLKSMSQVKSNMKKENYTEKEWKVYEKTYVCQKLKN